MDVVLLVAGKVLVGNFVANWIFRSLGSAPTSVVVQRTVLQYSVALLCAIAYLVYSGGAVTAGNFLTLLPIFLVGMLANSGFYFKQRANAISLSRFAVYEMLVAVIPIMLSATLLGEWVAFTNGLLLFGFVLAATGVTLYFIYDLSTKTGGRTTSVPLAFYGYGIAFMLSAGLTAFLMNYWAKAAVPMPLFLAVWYSGSLIGSGGLYAVSRFVWKKAETAAENHWTGKKKLLVFAGGLAVFANMWFLFGSFQQVELLVLAPFYITFDILGPLVMGMLFFKEWKTVHKWGYLFFGMDIAGTGIVGLARILSP